MNNQTTFDVGEPALTTRLAARYLGISVSLLNKLRGTGQGPAVQVYGKRCVYRRVDLDAFAAAHRIEPSLSDEGGAVVIYANVRPHTLNTLIADLGEPAAGLLALAARQNCIVGRQDQDLTPFTMQTVLGLPWVAIIRDDTWPHRPSRGPDGYHAASMVALLRAAYAVSLVVCDVDTGNYNAAAALAMTRRSSVIIETDTDQDGAWVAFIDAVAEGKRFSGDLAEIVARAQ